MAQEFYFAWVANGDTTFGVEHQVNDEEVVRCEIVHSESKIPAMSIVLRNPRVGLLNASHMQWAWVSWRKPDNTVVPLFHGRLNAMPTDVVQDSVSLDFSARPADYEAQKKALAETLRVAPFWDKLFIDEAQLEDPDVVLAARPQLYHVGRTDKLVTVSDILAGEDGSIVLGPDAIIRDSLDIQYGQPLSKVSFTATVEWKQAASGSVAMAGIIAAKFGGSVSSYTGENLESSWPRYGDSIGGGWTVGISHPNLLNTDIKKASILKVKINPLNDTPPDGVVPGTPEYDEWLRDRVNEPTNEARFARWDFLPRFDVHYEASRSRKEILKFDVVADVQALTSNEDSTERTTEISIGSTTVGDADKVTGVIPIGTPRARSYFDSDRGQDSIAYLLNYARSYILMAARAVDITVDLTSFELATALSCRKDVVLSVPELPGGVAGGKITNYSLSYDNGQVKAQVTFSCSIGKGNTLAAPDAGIASYVEVAYVDDYQVFYGESLQPVPGELEYVRPHYDPVDDGLNFDGLTPAGILKDLPATELLTFTGVGANGETITIGGRVYTLKTGALSANDVKIGADPDETARNLAAAMNRDEDQEGTTFGTGTVAHGAALGAAQDGILRATARVGGTAGNGIAVSSASAAATWGHATLQDGSEGLVVTGTPGQQAAVLQASPEAGSIKAAITRLNTVPTHIKVALKEVTGGPFETLITLAVEPLMVSRTINLEADAL